MMLLRTPLASAGWANVSHLQGGREFGVQPYPNTEQLHPHQPAGRPHQPAGRPRETHLPPAQAPENNIG